MKCFNLPEKISALIFDIDNTLYTNEAYAFEQVDVQVREFARLRGISADEARRMVSDERKAWADEHDGAQITLANIMLKFGIPVSQSISWRRELIKPEDFLKADERLVATIRDLSEKYLLIAVTNNPVKTGRRNLAALGIEGFFKDVVGLDTCGISKPAPEPFLKAVELLGVSKTECVSIGDRHAVDLATPLTLGMGGILVNGPEDLHELIKAEIL